MNKTLRTAVLTSVIALSSAFTTAAYADGYRNEGGASANQYQGQDQQQQQQQGQNQGQGQSQVANGGQGGQGGQAVSGSQSTATSGSISGANAQTGPIDIQNNSAGGAAHAEGGAAHAAGGAATAQNGPINVAPNQSTVNSFRSFVGTNAPNLVGSVDNCLAVLGWSAAVNVFGSTGIGIGGGNQRAEYIEQCAAVKSAFEVWNRADGDLAKETFAIDMLIKALPNYAAPAMERAVERINTYIEQNGDAQPDSVMSIFGARSFRKTEATATAPAAPANANGGVTINLNPVVNTIEKETVRTVTAAPKPAPKPAAPKPAPKPAAAKPDCACK
jgi:hypothetical protein